MAPLSKYLTMMLPPDDRRNKAWAILCVAAGTAFLVGCPASDSPPTTIPAPAARKGANGAEEAKAILKKAATPQALEQTLLSLCIPRDEKAFALFKELLLQPATWELLDTREDYLSRQRRLRIRKILQAIAKLDPDKASDLVLALANDKGFAAHYVRVDALIWACAGIKAPSPGVLEFLDKQAHPRSGTSNIIVGILAEIGTTEACNLIEKRMNSPEYDFANKREWAVTDLLYYRHEIELVRLYYRLLAKKGQDPKLQEVIVAAAFDYRPQEWYRHDVTPSSPKPVPRRDAADPKLQAKVTIVELNPPLTAVFTKFEQATGLKFTLDEAITAHRPKLGGFQLRDTPVWRIMGVIPKIGLVDGRWEKTENGYRLTGTPSHPIPS